MNLKFCKRTFLTAFGLAFLLAIPVKAEDALYCGDGMISPPEQCDDSNFVNRDGCSAYCALEDMTPPKVSTVSIPDGQTGVSNLTNQMIITFNEPVDPTTINATNVVFRQFNTPIETALELAEIERI